MSLVVAHDDIKPDQLKFVSGEGHYGRKLNTPFFRATSATPHSPTAFMVKYDPGGKSSAHFHIVDQFQILVDGQGIFGRHPVSPYSIHFSRAYTPYGPLLSDSSAGWTFMTLRTRYDPGAQRLPASKDKLKQIPDRKPWQITRKVDFAASSSGVNLLDIPDIKDDQGLYVQTLTMAPNAATNAPSAKVGDGQYVLALKGSLWHDGRECRAPTVVFVATDEEVFHVCAGAQGLEALILNFPQIQARAADATKPTARTGLKEWKCVLCAFSYDEVVGMPEDGIAPGTRWADVPDTWSCPDCGAAKSDFEMIEA